ncbi:MAG: sodium/solute symporter [Cyanobacteria bacterium]|nr:sodium/solute symporter [Cyanobacteriota bacterium]
MAAGRAVADAALNSGIDYLTQPSATIQYGLVLALGVLSWFAIYPWVSMIVFPFFRRLHVYSIYEYLESRFDVRVRTLAALIFVAWRLGWMATALYVPCLAINAASGGAIDITLMIVIAGVLVTLYTMLGGIQAVIWNDVIQFSVMFFGLGATVWIVATTATGGVAGIWSAADAAGKTGLWVPLAHGIAPFFQQPMTVPALFSALIVGRMAQYTTDQTMILRIQSTRTTREARQAFVVNAAGDALWMLGLTFVGLALFAYFQHTPAPEGLPPDRLLPYFMTQVFPAGTVGLVNAAILAASLSSVDAAVHSGSSVLVIDLYNRVFKGVRLDRHVGDPAGVDGHAQVRALRIAAVVMGVLGTTLASNVQGMGTLLEINKKVTDSFAGPLFGIFLLAMFSPRTSSAAALAGGAAGALAAYLVAYQSTIGFFWPSTFGLVSTLVVGVAISFVTPRPRADALAYTWRAIMQRPAGD